MEELHHILSDYIGSMGKVGIRAGGRLSRRSATATMKPPDLARFRLGWTVFIIAATSVVYLINWWSTPPGYHYTWILPPYPEDSFGYMAWAQQAAHGAWLFKIKYTALPHRPFLFHPLFLICGWASALASCDIGVVFSIVKATGVTLFLVTFYRYVDYLGLSKNQSIAATILVSVSSGLGGILAAGDLLGHFAVPPADLWMPEVSTFWSLLWNPLFPFSLTLMLLSIFWLDRGTARNQPTDLWRSGGAAGLLTLLHPYSSPLLFVWSAIVITARQKRRAPGYLGRYFAVSLPFAIYLWTVSRLNPLLARHGVVGEMKSPPIIALALGFGLLLVLLLVGLAVLRSQLLKKYWQLVLWFFLALLLAYFPFWFQRKLVFGAQIPLCILSAIIFDSLLARWIPRKRQTWTTIAIALILLPVVAFTPGYLLATEESQVRKNNGNTYFVSDELMEGLKFLRERTDSDQVVFATPETSRMIPAFAGNTVVWGHWAMSIDSKERQAQMTDSIGVESYLSGEERARLFWSTGIRYVFADGDLKQSIATRPFTWGFILKDTKKIFENRSVAIYERH
jgi:hypothetical protein